MKLIPFLLLTCLVTLSIAQSPVTTKSNLGATEYTIVTPPGKPKGMIICFTDFMQNSEQFLATTTLENQTYTYGLTTLVISCGSKSYADKQLTRDITQILTQTISDQKITKDKTIIGGLGSGGTIALRYAEYCAQFSADYPANPVGVFIIEAPLDLTFLYNSCNRIINQNHPAVNIAKYKVIKTMIESELGGTPDQSPENYRFYSPYNLNEENGGNLLSLKNIAIRSYNHGDFEWHLKNRALSLMDQNITCATEMINILTQLGNKKAELQIIQKERRNDPPFTNIWEGIDENELIIWSLNQMNISITTNAYNNDKN